MSDNVEDGSGAILQYRADKPHAQGTALLEAE
jgi:hypothetical protein